MAQGSSITTIIYDAESDAHHITTVLDADSQEDRPTWIARHVDDIAAAVLEFPPAEPEGS